VRRADHSEEEQQAVLGVLDSKAVVPADADVMRRAGELSGDLYRAGDPIDREDCIVAATAIQEGEPVVTRNADHFERVPHLDVLTY
jgi:predicted nucleic acid-binding protein